MPEVTQKECKRMFDLYLICLSYKYRPGKLRGRIMSWSSFLSIMVHLKIIEAKEKYDLKAGYAMWSYMYQRTNVRELPHSSKKKMAEIARDRRPLVTAVTKAGGGSVTTCMCITLNASHYLSERGLRYAEANKLKYQGYISEELFFRAIEEMYAGDKKGKNFNLAAVVNARKSNAAILSMIAFRGFPARMAKAA